MKTDTLGGKPLSSCDSISRRKPLFRYQSATISARLQFHGCSSSFKSVSYRHRRAFKPCHKVGTQQRCSTRSLGASSKEEQETASISGSHEATGNGASDTVTVATAIKTNAETPEHHSNGSDLTGSVISAASSAEKVPQRWRVVIMMAISFVLCNMDKVNMSVAVIPMANEMGWSATDRGLVNSAFFWGYSLTQVPAGWLSTWIGGSRVLFLGVLLWSIGTLAAPPAARVGLLALCATRVFVGLGEGLAPSSVTNVMARLVPERERARAVTTVFGGLDVGSAVGLLLCGPLIRVFGWPMVFYSFAILGLVWCVLWPFVRPEQEDPMMAEANALATQEGQNLDGTKAPVPWLDFFCHAPVWAVIIAHFCYNWGYYTLLSWLPSYFDLALGMTMNQSSILTLIPYIAMTAMTPFVGPVADGLVSRGWSVTNVRKLAQGIAFAGPALCMLACSMIKPGPGSAPLIVVLMSLAFALGAWSRAGLYCNHQDISPKYAAALLGISNTAGALPGVLGVTAAGYILDRTQSWSLAVFYPTAACQIFGLIVYTLFASSNKIKFKKPQKQA